VSNGISEELKREIGYACLEDDNAGETVEKGVRCVADRGVVVEGLKKWELFRESLRQREGSKQRTVKAKRREGAHGLSA